MIKPTALMGIILVSFLAFAVFQVEQRVQDYRNELSEINRQLLEDRDSIHVLRAEWSYLNQPNRLRDMANKHLKLNVVSSSQVAGVEAVSLRNIHLTSN